MSYGLKYKNKMVNDLGIKDVKLPEQQTVSNTVERVIGYTIHDYELIDMVGKVPLPVQIRISLKMIISQAS